MKLEVINGQRILTPDAEMFLCNEESRTISDKVYLGINADENAWTEITEAEKTVFEAKWYSEEFEEATETDYQNALAEMGGKSEWINRL